MSEGRGTRSAASRYGRRFSLCALGLGLAIGGWTGPPVHRSTGSISGNVVVSTALAARRPDFRIYADPGTGSIPPAPRSRDQLAAELKNVVIYLEGDSTTLPAPPERAERYRHGSIAQRDERFVPHVLPVLRGAVVQFPNEDNVYHNVFSLSSEAAPNGKGFDLGRYPKGSSKAWTFDTPGTVLVFCHIHQDMSAVVLVRPNPYLRLARRRSPLSDRRRPRGRLHHRRVARAGQRGREADPRYRRTDDDDGLQHSPRSGAQAVARSVS